MTHYPVNSNPTGIRHQLPSINRAPVCDKVTRLILANATHNIAQSFSITDLYRRALRCLSCLWRNITNSMGELAVKTATKIVSIKKVAQTKNMIQNEGANG